MESSRQKGANRAKGERKGGTDRGGGEESNSLLFMVSFLH